MSGAALAPCPFVGLQPYDESHAAYFFGRERDVRSVVANAFAAPFIVLYGPSGTGKTSVLLAGVVGELRRSTRTVVVVFRTWQGLRFHDSLKQACRQALVDAGETSVAPATAPLDEILRSTRRTVLLILDQFEEYFLYHPEETTGVAFEVELARVVNDEEIDGSVIVSLREDAVSRLDRFRARIPNLLGNMVRIDHLDMEAAERAIRMPVQVWNERWGATEGAMGIEDELVRSVLDQVRAGRLVLGRSGSGQARTHEGRVEVAYLQLVVTRLWNEERAAGSRRLRLETFRRLGGASSIVRDHLTRQIQGLDRSQREVCRRVFDRLVTPSGSKVALAAENLREWAGDLAPAVDALLGRLVAARILRAVPDPDGIARYEIFHDVLGPAIADWQARDGAARTALQWAVRVSGAWLVLGLLALLSGGTLVVRQSRQLDDKRRELTHQGEALQARERAVQVCRSEDALRQTQEWRKDSVVVAGWGVDPSQVTEVLKDKEWATAVFRANELCLTLKARMEGQPWPPVVLWYFAKRSDRRTLGSSLKDLGFRYEQKPLQLNLPTNSLWAGRDVPPDAIRLIALTAIRAGARLRCIDQKRAWADIGRQSLVQVGASSEVSRWPILAPDAIMEADFSDSRLCGPARGFGAGARVGATPLEPMGGLSIPAPPVASAPAPSAPAAPLP